MGRRWENSHELGIPVGSWVPRKSARLNFFRGEVSDDSKDVLVNGETSLVRVLDAGEKGKGIFAKEAIPAGRFVFLARGSERVMNTQIGFREREDGEMVRVSSPGDIADLWMDKPNSVVTEGVIREDSLGGVTNHGVVFKVLEPDDSSPLRYLNHSCDPNLMRSGLSPYVFVPLRDIEAGEELTVDYSTLEVNNMWKMQCRCGAENCRKVISSVQYLPLELAEKYWKSLQPFMKEVYLACVPATLREDVRVRALKASMTKKW